MDRKPNSVHVMDYKNNSWASNASMKSMGFKESAMMKRKKKVPTMSIIVHDSFKAKPFSDNGRIGQRPSNARGLNV